jgi:hypothetical protein
MDDLLLSPVVLLLSSYYLALTMDDLLLSPVAYSYHQRLAPTASGLLRLPDTKRFNPVPLPRYLGTSRVIET